MKRYPWPGTLNTRDLGGVQTADGRRVQPLRFLRGDAPRAVSDEMKAFLLQNGIRTVIDLREASVAAASPSGFGADGRFFCRNIPLAVPGKPAETEAAVIEAYCRMLENDDAIAGIFGTMANAAGGVLFHCQEGKDRTGLVAALLLLLAGVPDIDIFADYALSNAYLYEMIKLARPLLPEHLLYAKISCLEETLRYLRDRYGTAERYLLAKGLSQTDVQTLKAKLLDQSAENGRDP